MKPCEVQKACNGMSSKRKPMILCLGMSFPCVSGSIRKCAMETKKRVRSFACCAERELSVDYIADLVEARILTEMDGRDLLRCWATEQVCGVDVFSVSQEQGAAYRLDRHLDADFNNRNFMKRLKKHVGGHQFDQIVLDYFWIPSGWDADHWRWPFFAKTLLAFAEDDMLTMVSDHPEFSANGCRRGVVYLPFCFHCLKAIVALHDEISVFFRVAFLRRGELSEVALWAGTRSIDGKMMASVFGKDISQEEIYCRVTVQQLRSMEDEPFITKADLLKFVRQLTDLSSIRFIVLELLPSSAVAAVGTDSRLATVGNGLEMEGKCKR